MAQDSAGERRGGGGVKRTYVEGIDQHMPQGLKWQEILRSSANKDDLIRLIVSHVKSLNELNKLKGPFIITNKEHTNKLIQDKSILRSTCNHEEANTRLVLHAFLENNNVIVVVSKDTDVLVLMIWAYLFFNVLKEWFFKYGNDKFANIAVICDTLGTDLFIIFTGFSRSNGMRYILLLQRRKNKCVQEVSCKSSTDPLASITWKG